MIELAAVMYNRPMTRFQRRALAIISDAYLEKLGDQKSGIDLAGKYATVYDEGNQRLAMYKVISLSWNSVDLQDEYTHFKVFRQDASGYVELKSEDEEHIRIRITNIDRSFVKGQDGKAKYFYAQTYGYQTIKINDGEMDRDYIYKIDWS